MAKALEGTRVLDLSRMYAGPFGTMLLAELGAEVIKVESPEGDAVRTLPPRTEGSEGYVFVILNRGKRSITLDLSSEVGQSICKELAKKCDVLVENFTPGTMEGFGLGYDSLKEVNPRLIYASISGFGHTGPYRSHPAFDTIIQSMGGLLSVNGHPGCPPTKVGPGIADFLGGIYSVVSILSALQYRSREDRGQFIDISMQDCVWLVTAIQFLPGYLLTGREPGKLGNRQVELTPFNIYRAKDGYIVICIATIAQWQRFLEVIGRKDLMDVPEYASQFDRIKHIDEIDAVVEQWSRERTVQEMISQLRVADLPCAPVPTFSQVASDPQLAHRRMQVEIEQLVSGRLRVPGSVFKMSETPGNAGQPAPFLGQNNYEVYSELLDYDPARIDKLRNEGVI